MVLAENDRRAQGAGEVLSNAGALHPSFRAFRGLSGTGLRFDCSRVCMVLPGLMYPILEFQSMAAPGVSDHPFECPTYSPSLALMVSKGFWEKSCHNTNKGP